MTEEAALMFDASNIVCFDRFTEQLKELEAVNNIVFEYDTPEGAEEAKKHIKKLKKSVTVIEKVRKQEKQASLDYGRNLDKQAKELKAVVERLVNVHQKPLDEIAKKEADRIAAIRQKIDAISNSFDAFAWFELDVLSEKIDQIKSMEIDDSFAEFKEEAAQVKFYIAGKLQAQLDDRIRQQKEEAEAKQREEEARKEREKQIAEQAAKDAVDKYKAEQVESESDSKPPVDEPPLRVISSITSADKPFLDVTNEEIVASIEKVCPNINRVDAERLVKAIRGGRIAGLTIS